MEIIYLLIPLAFLLVVAMAAIFFWAVKSGQFDDLDGPGFRVLDDDEENPEHRQEAVNEVRKE